MGMVLVFAAAFAISCVIYAACMIVGVRIAGGGGSFLHLVAIAAIGSLVAMIPIPFVAWIASFIVMLVLLARWIGVDAWPEGVFILVIAGCLSLVARLFIVAGIAAAVGGG